MLSQDRLIYESKHFCMMPWVQLHLWPAGQAFPCCQWDSEKPVGTYGAGQGLHELWNAPAMQAARSEMLEDRPVAACTRCYDVEAQGLPSMRQASLDAFPHHWDLVQKTTHAGRTLENRMAYLDIRFSNRCNLRCQTCGPELSSGWYEDQTALFGQPPHAKILEVGPHDQLWSELLPQLRHVEHAYFAGGEPLICDEHYRILDHWLEIGRTGVRINYTTNFTLLEHKHARVLDYWKRFPNVRVSASLDDSGARAEYLRKGTSWAVIEKNRERMLQECPGTPFEITPTISAFNVWHFPEFHLDWVERGFIGPADAVINILTYKPEHSMRVLPTAFKREVADKWRDYGARLASIARTRGADVAKVEASYQAVIDHLLGRDDSALLPEFFRRMDQVNKVRHEDVFAVYPELKRVWEQA